MQARLSPARIESILTTVRRVREGLSLMVKQFQKTAGSDGSCVQRDTFWPAVHETPTVVAQVQGVLPEGKPVSHDQGHVTLAMDASLTGWGGGHEWPPCPRSVEWSPSHVAHQLPGDAGHVSSIKTFSSGPKKSQCASTHRQHSCGFLYQPPGRSSLAPLIQAGAPDPCVVPGQVPLAESSLYSWESQCRSRHPVEAGEWRLHPEVVKQIWRVFDQAQVDLFATHQTLHCPLWYSLTHPAPLPGVLERVCRDGVRLLLVAPFWPGRVWFSDLVSLLNSSPWEIPVRRDLLSQAEGIILYPRPELWKLWVWPLLLAISSLKRVGDLQALSVALPF